MEVEDNQINKQAYDAESKGFNLVDPGSGGALAGSIAEAYEKGEGWLGYYWAPTAIFHAVG